MNIGIGIRNRIPTESFNISHHLCVVNTFAGIDWQLIQKCLF